jgi:hypothetical protein
VEVKVSRFLRERNEAENSVNAVDTPFSNISQIVEGGCYHGPSSWESAKFESPPNLGPASRRWIAVAALALIVIIAFTVLRYFSRK